MDALLTIVLDNIVILIVGLSVLLIIIVAIKKSGKNHYKYNIINSPIGNKLDPGVIPNDKYPKQDNDINNMF